MTDRKDHKKRALRRGAATVEFALTAPILFMLLMGAIEFSRANMLRHTTVVAATEGARRSIIPGATAVECEQAATQELTAVGFKSSDVVVTPPVIDEKTSQVTVSVEVPMNGANGFVLPNFLKGAKMKKAVTLQREAAREDPSTEPGKKGNGSGSSNSGSGS